MNNGSKNVTITVPRALIQRAAGVAVVPLDEYEALLEDVEILKSKHLARDIAVARDEIERGEFVTLAEVKARLKK